MPMYPLKCRACGAEDERYAPIHVGKSSTACDCGDVLYRVYTMPATPTGFQPHFSHTVGAYVNTEREFKDHLRRGSEEMSRRMNGMPVNFESRPLAEVPHNEEGMDATRRRRREMGLDEPKRSYH